MTKSFASRGTLSGVEQAVLSMLAQVPAGAVNSAILNSALAERGPDLGLVLTNCALGLLSLRGLVTTSALGPLVLASITDAGRLAIRSHLRNARPRAWTTKPTAQPTT